MPKTGPQSGLGPPSRVRLDPLCPPPSLPPTPPTHTHTHPHPTPPTQTKWALPAIALYPLSLLAVQLLDTQLGWQ